MNCSGNQAASTENEAKTTYRLPEAQFSTETGGMLDYGWNKISNGESDQRWHTLAEVISTSTAQSESSTLTDEQLADQTIVHCARLRAWLGG